MKKRNERIGARGACCRMQPEGTQRGLYFQRKKKVHIVGKRAETMPKRGKRSGPSKLDRLASRQFPVCFLFPKLVLHARRCMDFLLQPLNACTAPYHASPRSTPHRKPLNRKKKGKVKKRKPIASDRQVAHALASAASEMKKRRLQVLGSGLQARRSI